MDFTATTSNLFLVSSLQLVNITLSQYKITFQWEYNYCCDILLTKKYLNLLFMNTVQNSKSSAVCWTRHEQIKVSVEWHVSTMNLIIVRKPTKLTILVNDKYQLSMISCYVTQPFGSCRCSYSLYYIRLDCRFSSPKSCSSFCYTLLYRVDRSIMTYTFWPWMYLQCILYMPYLSVYLDCWII